MTLSPATLKRLQASLNGHRRRAEKMGLPADDIRVADLLAKSDTNERGEYLCYRLDMVLTFDPDKPQAPNKATIGHGWPLSVKSGSKRDKPHPGHTLENVFLESWLSNSRDNHKVATPCAASQKRHTPDKARAVKRKEKSADKPKTKWPKGRTLPTKADRERVRNK